MPDIDPQIITELTIISLREGKSPFVLVTSNSMSPLIRTGDELKITAAVISDLEPGDIIALDTADGMLAHRYWNLIQSTETDQILTKADSSVYFDPPFELAEYIGLIVARKRGETLLSFRGIPARWFNQVLFRLFKLDHRFNGVKSRTLPIRFNSQIENENKVNSGIGPRLIHFFVYALVRMITFLLDVTTHVRIR